MDVDQALAALAKTHSDVCATATGYRQIKRVRERFRRAGVDEDLFPEYDARCREAWADYIMARRDKENLGGRPGWPDVEAPHGTYTALRKHRRERGRLRRQGVAEVDLPPICDLCRVLGGQEQQKRAREAKKLGTRKPRVWVQKLDPQRVTPSTATARCGTEDGVRKHLRQQRRQRAKGQEVTPICADCEIEQIRLAVIRNVDRGRAANEA
jgi:hypothetical protein